ncbi:hypothetical protein [Lactobacillus helveticus]|uniref:hypothetical protein n=1 Tax=Lactobacillus helveticus TaxID=1587 RepID=UPI001C64B261|nr:hypothetical protein [Lactobacillus helveticus]MBW8008327.1 hypothetical protein [Lactobacillus helveticus]MBW8018637.1 hypothetical protein [Lactobacillus helveticus]MBW8043215.1 hypothetical protein [Lactobacillus helveticus]MBW8052729.1 hypothetical protein [Lactobacillus helveticus]
MADYAKRQLKALDRIAKKISDAESHLTKIEDSEPDRRHRTAQHETINDIKSILKHAKKVSADNAKIEGKADEDHYVYVEDEEGVIKDLDADFKELDEKLDKLSDTDGYDIKRYLEEHHSLDKAKEILVKAGKLN